MPEIDIGPFTAKVGPEDAKETVRYLRIGSVTSNTVKLPDGVEDVGAALVHVTELLQVQESKLSELIMSFRQGEVGFEQGEDGKVTRWYFKYPEWAESEKGAPS